MLGPLGPTLWRRVCGRVTMMRTRMQPVQKLAEPHSVASNGANAINDAHIINHDEEHGADLAPTDDLYGVLRTIGINVADLLNALGRLHTRVRRLATRHAPSPRAPGPCRSTLQGEGPRRQPGVHRET